jgi:alpha-beta hydrolase superfamily lysophospholipase
LHYIGDSCICVPIRSIDPKRGEGNFYATGAEAAFSIPSGVYKARKEINSRQIGLAGHSEGGLIAPIVAARSKDVAFVIMLAGPGIPGDSSILLQMAVLQRVRKYPEAQIQHARAVFGGALKIVKHSSDRTILRERLKQYINANQWNKESRPKERE